MMKFLTTTVAFLLVGGSAGFSARDMDMRRSATKVVLAAQNANQEGASRRAFISQAAVSSAVLLGSLAGSGVMAPLPAQAISGDKKVNAKLAGYGLPALEKTPDGMIPLLEVYGKGKNRTPLLVSFSHPLSWVVTLPSNTVNGEDGTVQAGDYGKGDTATFFLYTDPGLVKDFASQPKDVFDKAIRKSIGQKGDNMYQNFKLTKVSPVGSDYVIVDFKYQLITGAGFEVDRVGVASITSVGSAVQVLWTATTAARYKKMETIMRDIAASFRCYADGLDLSDELSAY
jgi:hypothetical protein